MSQEQRPKGKVAALTKNFEGQQNSIIQPLKPSNVLLRQPVAHAQQSQPTPKPTVPFKPESLISQQQSQSKPKELSNSMERQSAPILLSQQVGQPVFSSQKQMSLDRRPSSNYEAIRDLDFNIKLEDNSSSEENPFEDPDNLILDNSPFATSTTSSLQVSPSLTETLPKRQKIIKEIMDTEKAYLLDLRAVEDCYLKTAACSTVLSPAHIKTIFINLADLIRFTSRFISDMLLKQKSFVDVLMLHIDELDAIYCEYCKKHETCVAKIVEITKEADSNPEIKQYLMNAALELSKKTKSPPDLGAMLLKPVQRVLKYPLFLKELSKNTPTDHAEYALIQILIDRMAKVAENINEVKRRKDTVDKFLNDKRPKNIQHGINKTLSRHAQQLKMATGLLNIEPTVDTEYDQLEDLVEFFQDLLTELKMVVYAYIDACSIYVETSDRLGAVWEDLLVFDQNIPEHSRPAAHAKLTNWRNLLEAILTEKSNFELDGTIPHILGMKQFFKQNFADPIDECLQLFNHPQTLMKTRNKKILDFDRVRDIKASGEQPDTTLVASSKDYALLNTQLLEELPKFLKLLSRFVAAILERWVEFLSHGWWRNLSLSVTRVACEFEARLAFADDSSIESIYNICKGWDIIREYHSFINSSHMDETIRLLPMFDQTSSRRHLRRKTDDVGDKDRSRSLSRSQSHPHSLSFFSSSPSDNTPSLRDFSSASNGLEKRKSVASVDRDLIDFGDDGGSSFSPAISNQSISYSSSPVSASQLHVDAFSTKIRKPAAEGPIEPPESKLISKSPLMRCISIYPFSGTLRHQLVFGPGIEFDVLYHDERIGWYWVVNKRTEEIGWVPARHLTRIS